MAARKIKTRFNLPIDKIRPYPNNARQISDEAVRSVADSIHKYGMRQPIVVDTDGVIIVGHTRYFACQQLEFKEVWCEVAENLSNQEIREYRLVDNRTGEMTSWDINKLSKEMESMSSELSEEMLELIGFEDVEIATLLAIRNEDEWKDELKGAQDANADGVDKALGSGFVVMSCRVPKDRVVEFRQAIQDLIQSVVESGK